MTFHQKQIDIRNHIPGDWNFMYATYLRHNWYDKTNSTTLKKDHWMELQNKRLTNVFKKQTIKIACLKIDSNVIVGYAFEDGEKPFCYIRPRWKPSSIVPFDIKEILLKSLEEMKNEQRQD